MFRPHAAARLPLATALTLASLSLITCPGCSGSSSRAVEPAQQAADQQPLTDEEVQIFASEDQRIEAEEGGVVFKK